MVIIVIVEFQPPVFLLYNFLVFSINRDSLADPANGGVREQQQQLCGT